MLAATKVKMSGSQKKSEQEHLQRFLHKTRNYDVSGRLRCSRAKQRQRKCARR